MRINAQKLVKKSEFQGAREIGERDGAQALDRLGLQVNPLQLMVPEAPCKQAAPATPGHCRPARCVLPGSVRQGKDLEQGRKCSFSQIWISSAIYENTASASDISIFIRSGKWNFDEKILEFYPLWLILKNAIKRVCKQNSSQATRFSFFFFLYGSHPTMLYSWLCSQELLLLVFRGP